MKTINEIKQEFIGLQQDFNQNVQDNFSRRINQDILEPSLNHYNILCMQEEKIKAEVILIQKMLLKAQSILPILKG